MSSVLEFLSSFADKEAQEEAAKPGIARKAARGLWDSFVTLPGDVYLGKREATPEAGMDFAMNMAGPNALVPKPANSLGIFGGRNAMKYPHSMEPVAEFMEKGGVSRDKIWEATGLERGKDKQWRFEIDDSAAKLDPKFGQPGERFGSAGKYFSHPELYENYPQMQRVELGPQTGDFNGSYHGGEYPSIEINQTRSLPEQRSTMLHELQHWVQDIEGFARGGNSKDMAGRSPPQADRIRHAQKLITQKRWAIQDRHLGREPNPQELTELRALFEVDGRLQQYLNEIEDPYSQYRRLAGETEARNVQDRDRLRQRINEQYPGENLTAAPWRTEDVPRRLQDVLFR
jgi:hypothetical protein